MSLTFSKIKLFVCTLTTLLGSVLIGCGSLSLTILNKTRKRSSDVRCQKWTRSDGLLGPGTSVHDHIVGIQDLQHPFVALKWFPDFRPLVP